MKSARVSFEKALIVSGFLILIAVGFSACNKDDDSSPTPNTGSGLMAFNLAPDLDNLGIALSGNRLSNSPLNFTNFTGTYLPIYSGERAIEAYDFFTDSTLTNSSFNFEDTSYFSLFVVGNKGVYTNLVVKDDFDSLTASSGQAYIRYINAIPDSSAPTVSIVAGGSSVVNNTSPFATASDFTGVAPGEVTIGVSNENTISASRTINLEAGKAYTALLIGDPSATDSIKMVQIKYIENGKLAD